MAITGTIKVGSRLVIDVLGASNVDYNITVSGYDVSIQKNQIKNAQSFGPYKNSATYSITVNSGSPAIYTENPDGVKEYTAATLPDPAAVQLGEEITVSGEPLASNGQFWGRYIKKPALPKSDGVLLYDAVITFGANAIITSSSGAFSQNDVGKRVAFYEKISGAFARSGNGVIVAVTNATTVVTNMTVSGAANVLVAAVAYGTASGAYINSYLQSIKKHGGCDVPNSIYICETKIILPNGVSLEGNGRKGGFDLPHNANLIGANAFVCATSAYQADGTSFFDIG